MKIDTCYLCGSKNYKVREGNLRDSDEISVLECLDCGLVFLDKHICDEAFYADNQMLNQDFFASTKRDNSGSLKDNIREFEIDWHIFTTQRVERLKNELVGKDILDFGSGHAQFLTLAKQYAKSVSGVELEEQVESIYKENNITLYKTLQDLDSTLCAKNRGGGGANLSPNTESKNNTESKKFDVITLFHVLEHLSDPIAMLKTLKNYLKENGKIIIEVPNANEALISIFDNTAFKNMIYTKVHLYAYSATTLEMIAKKAGLKVEFIKGIQRYPLSNTLYWLAKNKPAGQKTWGGFIDNPRLQHEFELMLSSINATDTLMAQFRI